jgi:hypothetical protein
MHLFDAHVATKLLVTDSVPLRPGFNKWLGANLHVCSIAPLIACAIPTLCGQATA